MSRRIHMTADQLPQLLPSGDIDAAVDGALIERAFDEVIDGREKLVDYTTEQIATRLAQVNAAWLADEDGVMAHAVEAISERCGYSPAMVEWSLRDILRRLTHRSMIALVEAELGSREPFQSPRNTELLPCARGAHPPDSILYVLADTVPPVAIEAVVLVLMSRAPSVIKTSSADPITARLYLESIRKWAPDLAEYVAVLTWTGGDDDLDQTACQRPSTIVAYGSNSTVDALQARCTFPTRFFGYGHRVSFGVVGPHDGSVGVQALDRLAHDIALDASAYDQRGCMSPHALFVSRAALWSAEAIAEQLAKTGFPQVATELPRGELPTAMHAAIMQQRGLAEFDGRAFESDDALVLLQNQLAFYPTPGGRTLHVVPYDEPDDLFETLEPLRGAISTVGLLYESSTRNEFVHRLGRLGARRVCRLGRMQRPLWLRDHDGRPRIGDWVEWTDIEPLY